MTSNEQNFSTWQNKDFWQQQMDLLVKQAVTKSGDQKTAPSTPTSFNKPCRYGTNCTRHSCRFMHPGQTVTGNHV